MALIDALCQSASLSKCEIGSRTSLIDVVMSAFNRLTVVGRLLKSSLFSECARQTPGLQHKGNLPSCSYHQPPYCGAEIAYLGPERSMLTVYETMTSRHQRGNLRRRMMNSDLALQNHLKFERYPQLLRRRYVPVT